MLLYKATEKYSKQFKHSSIGKTRWDNIEVLHNLYNLSAMPDEEKHTKI